jgi:RHS repeat-associated protein
VREYVYLPDSFVPVAQITASGVAWLGTDVNGAVTELHDGSGRLLAQGAPSTKGGIEGLGAACRLRGQGQYEDEESGLYYTRHRFFDPRIEQFVSTDPLGLAPGENVCRLGPNVWGWVDPWGLAATTPPTLPERTITETGDCYRIVHNYNDISLEHADPIHFHVERGSTTVAKIRAEGSVLEGSLPKSVQNALKENALINRLRRLERKITRLIRFEGIKPGGRLFQPGPRFPCK